MYFELTIALIYIYIHTHTNPNACRVVRIYLECYIHPAFQVSTPAVQWPQLAWFRHPRLRVAPARFLARFPQREGCYSTFCILPWPRSVTSGTTAIVYHRIKQEFSGTQASEFRHTYLYIYTYTPTVNIA